jgi:hypothetical protein
MPPGILLRGDCSAPLACCCVPSELDVGQNFGRGGVPGLRSILPNSIEARRTLRRSELVTTYGRPNVSVARIGDSLVVTHRYRTLPTRAANHVGATVLLLR